MQRLEQTESGFVEKPLGWRDMNDLFPTPQKLSKILSFVETWHIISADARKRNFNLLTGMFPELELTWGDMEQLAEEFKRHPIKEVLTVEKPGREEFTLSAKVFTRSRYSQQVLDQVVKKFQQIFHKKVNAFEN